MSIVLVRIDDRLIHGQVVEGWAKFTKANCIIVANDGVANNDFQKMVMEIAVPAGMKLEINSVQEAIKEVCAGKFEKDRAIILFSNIKDILKAIEYGLKISCLNLGGLRYCSGTKQISEAVAIQDEDINDLKKIVDLGIKIEIRLVPTEKPVDIVEILGRGINN